MIDYQLFDSLKDALKSDAPHVHLASPKAFLPKDILKLADRDALMVTTTDEEADLYYDVVDPDKEEVPFTHNLTLLSQLPNLKALHLRSKLTFNHMPSALKLLVQLEGLELSLYTSRYDELLGLTSLQSLNVNFLKGSLKNLLNTIPKVQTLKRLTLRSNLKAIPQPLIQFQQLEHLNIMRPDSDNFHNIIKKLCKMRHLKTLVLKCNSHVHELPEEIIGLDFLELFELQFPKSTKNLRLPQAFLDHPKPFVTTTQSTIKSHYEFLQSDVKDLPEGTKDLIQAINIDNRKLLSELIPNPFDQDFQSQKAVFFLAGRTNKMGFTKKEIKEKLKEYGIKVSTKLTDKVTHLLLGSAIKSNIIDHIIQRPDLKLVLDDHFRQYALDQDEGFLKEEGSEDLHEKVLALLLNPNPTNAIIGINMLETGGINSPVFMTIVMLLSTSAKDKEVRKAARKVFNQNASESLKDTLNKEKKNLTLGLDKKKNLYQHAEVDMPTYVVMVPYLNGHGLFPYLHMKTLPPVVKYFRNVRDISLSFKEIDILQAMDLLVQIPDVKSIELIDTALKEVPAKLSSMHSLESIRINNNSLSTIPESITTLPNLKTLDISGNPLESLPTHFTGHSISAEKCQLRSLPKQLDWKACEVVYLNHNELESLSTDSILPDLTYLRVENNKLQEIKLSQKQFPSLDLLHLANNHIHTISLDPKLELSYLHISHNRLQEINLTGLPKLDTIFISNNKLTSFCLDLPNLTRLNISDNNIRDISNIELLPSLRQLSMEHNPITDLSPLKKLKNLVTLCFDPNPEIDYKVLRELSNPSFNMQVPYELKDYEYVPLWYVLRYKSLKRFNATETIIDPPSLREVWRLIRKRLIKDAEELALSEGWDMEIFQMYLEL